MNLDFILFNPPERKHTFLDLWGEVIFIPSFKPVSLDKQSSTPFLASLTNCYGAPKSNEVYFSIEGALSEQTGEFYKAELDMGTSATDSGLEEEEISHHIPCLFLDSMVGSKYLILYFHSSGEDIKTAHGLLNYLRNSYQANVLAMEYPGYSIYKGSANSKQVNEDARTVYGYVIKKLGFQERDIIVIGRSIGTGVALELLKTKKETQSFNPRCLTLISPFASVKNLVKEFIGRFGTFLAKETYDNIENILSVKCPVLAIHGEKDTFISCEHSKELIKHCYSRKSLLTPQNMTHGQFDYYIDLVDPLREFLHEEGVNFYEQNMRGPTVPEELFNCPPGSQF